MNKLKLLLFTGLLLSCSQPKLLLFYGTEQKYLIYSDSTIINGNVTFKIKNCVFKFKGVDFENELSKQLEEYSKPDYNYLNDNYLIGDYKLLITDTENGLTLNDTLKVKFPLDYSIKIVLDKLVQDGKFHLTQNGKDVCYIEHFYWEPQYQGPIFSKWIINERTIFEMTHGYVD